MWGNRRGYVLAIGVAAFVVVAASVAYAASAIVGATSSDPLVVCVNDTNGEMRAVAGAGACRANESPIELQKATGPQSVTVDCAAGQKVGDVLAATADNPAPLTITIVGTCTEAVNVPRDDVVLRASAPGDGLAAPGAGATVLSVSGVRIRLGRLGLSGGANGLVVSNGGQFFAIGLTVTGFANTGILVAGNSSGNVQDSTVDGGSEGVSVAGGSSLGYFRGNIGNSGSGASARSGGSLALGGGVVVSGSAGHGIIAYPGGTIELQGVVRNSGNTGAYAFGGSISAGGNATVIEGSRFGGLSAEDGGTVSLAGGARSTGNGVGVAANNGGAVLIQDGSIVENNNGAGVQLMNGSSLRMRGGAIVRGNAQHGIFLGDTSTASFGPSPSQISGNGGWGVLCAGPPAVAQLAAFSLNWVNASGNTSGQVSCPTSGPPFATVDCAAGDTVAAALAAAPPTGRYSITVKGTCTEAVRLDRDETTLRAFAPGDGLTAPAGAFSVLAVNDARRVDLDQLTLRGGQNGLSVGRGATVSAHGLRVVDAANTGVGIFQSASVQLNNPTVENAGHAGIQASSGGVASIHGGAILNTDTFGIGAQSGGDVSVGGGTVVRGTRFIGLYAAFSGSIDVFSATIEANGTGAMANQGGAIHFNGAGGIVIRGNDHTGVAANNGGSVAVSAGTRVVNNRGGGVSAFNSAAIQVEGSFVQDNGGDGIVLSGASSAQIQNSTITGHARDGVLVADTSVAQFGFPSGNNTITGNGGWGVRCETSPSVALIRGGIGNVSGNIAGQVSCPTP